MECLCSPKLVNIAFILVTLFTGDFRGIEVFFAAINL